MKKFFIYSIILAITTLSLIEAKLDIENRTGHKIKINLFDQSEKSLQEAQRPNLHGLVENSDTTKKIQIKIKSQNKDKIFNSSKLNNNKPFTGTWYVIYRDNKLSLQQTHAKQQSISFKNSLDADVIVTIKTNSSSYTQTINKNKINLIKFTGTIQTITCSSKGFNDLTTDFTKKPKLLRNSFEISPVEPQLVNIMLNPLS